MRDWRTPEGKPFESRRQRLKYQRLKDEFLDQYGRRCVGPSGRGCPDAVSDPVVLTIAHLNNDGRHRPRGPNNAIKDLKKRGWPKDEGIGVQCMNCQFRDLAEFRRQSAAYNGAPPALEPQRCKGWNKRKMTRCKRWANPGLDFCEVHK